MSARLLGSWPERREIVGLCDEWGVDVAPQKPALADFDEVAVHRQCSAHALADFDEVAVRRADLTESLTRVGLT